MWLLVVVTLNLYFPVEEEYSPTRFTFTMEHVEFTPELADMASPEAQELQKRVIDIVSVQ